jgi:hypothetical protein
MCPFAGRLVGPDKTPTVDAHGEAAPMLLAAVCLLSERWRVCTVLPPQQEEPDCLHEAKA